MPQRRAKPPAAGSLPAHGQSILDAVYESAKASQLAQGRSEKAAKRAAAAQAWCAVKRQYYKRGKKWIKRKQVLGRGEQPPGCKPYRGGRRRNPTKITPAERNVLERLIETAERTGDDWGTITSVDGYLKDDEEERTPIEYLNAVYDDVMWHYGHVGDDDDPTMDKASAKRAQKQIANAQRELEGLRAGGAGYEQALASVNRDRARRGERPLDPKAAGWTADDVMVEAARIGRRNPGKRTRRNPISRQKREALARELGGGLRADATVDDLLGYMRSIESSGRISYDDDLEDDPTTPKPDLEDLWDELWDNYGEDTQENPDDQIHWNELAGFDPPLFESDPIEVPVRGLGVFRLRAATHYVRNNLKPIKFGKNLGYDSSFIEVLEVGVPGRHKWGDAQKVTAGPLVLADAKRAVDLWREGKPFTSDNGRIADVYPKGYSTPRNPSDYEDDLEVIEQDIEQDIEDIEEKFDKYGRRISDYEQHMAESDLVPNPEIWVVVALENSRQWPISPAKAVTRDEALNLPGLGGAREPYGPRWIALRTGFRTANEARSYADKVEHATIEVARPSDGTVVYRGSLLGFSDDPAVSGLKYVDRGRLVGLAESNVETQLGQGKKALIARRDRSGNPMGWEEPKLQFVFRERSDAEAFAKWLKKDLGVRSSVRKALPEYRNTTSKGTSVFFQTSRITDTSTAATKAHAMGGWKWGDFTDYQRAMGMQGASNPYLGDAVELAQKRRYDEERARWEREGRRGPPPAPPRSRQRNPAGREAKLGRRITGV